jgi:hypothetical protein
VLHSFYLTHFVIILYMNIYTSTSLLNNLSKMKMLLDMYLNSIDTQHSSLMTRPISLNEINISLKTLIKTSRYLQSIEMPHLKMSYCILMSILKNCFNINNIIINTTNKADIDVVFFNDLIHITNELFCVLDKKCKR